MNSKNFFVSLIRAGKPDFPAERSVQDFFRYAGRLTLFWGLAGCSLLYSGVVRVRVALYRRNLLRQEALPRPVISVGNITTGGTGKTPAVIEIARILARHRTRVAVLSRGYQRDSSVPTLVVEPDSDVSQVGDEPLLMMRKFRQDLGAPLPCPAVIVGSRRYRSGLLALERFEPDVMLLDDGFQHLPLARDCDLVLLDATNPFGGGYLLPAGFLREPAGHLRRAAAFIITRSNEVAEVESVAQALVRLNPGAPIFTAIHAFSGFRELGKNVPVAAETLAQQRLLAVSGLGNPDSFRRLLQSQGVVPLGSLDFPDHHEYTQEDGLAIACACRKRKIDALMTSEKDESKLLPVVEGLGIPCYVAMVKFSIRPEKEFEELLLKYLPHSFC